MSMIVPMADCAGRARPRFAREALAGLLGTPCTRGQNPPPDQGGARCWRMSMAAMVGDAAGPTYRLRRMRLSCPPRHTEMVRRHRPLGHCRIESDKRTPRMTSPRRTMPAFDTHKAVKALCGASWVSPTAMSMVPMADCAGRARPRFAREALAGLLGPCVHGAKILRDHHGPCDVLHTGCGGCAYRALRDTPRWFDVIDLSVTAE